MTNLEKMIKDAKEAQARMKEIWNTGASRNSVYVPDARVDYRSTYSGMTSHSIAHPTVAAAFYSDLLL